MWRVKVWMLWEQTVEYLILKIVDVFGVNENRMTEILWLMVKKFGVWVWFCVNETILELWFRFWSRSIEVFGVMIENFDLGRTVLMDEDLESLGLKIECFAIGDLVDWVWFTIDSLKKSTDNKCLESMSHINETKLYWVRVMKRQEISFKWVMVLCSDWTKGREKMMLMIS